MSYPVVLRRAARSEYIRSKKWYNDQRPGLGSAFEAAVRAVLDVIASQPDHYPIADGDVRFAPVHGFPYCVYYRIRSGRVIVISVFHESRDPSEWQSRS